MQMSFQDRTHFEFESNSENQFQFISKKSRKGQRKNSFSDDQYSEQMDNCEEHHMVMLELTDSMQDECISPNCEDRQSQNSQINSITQQKFTQEEPKIQLPQGKKKIIKNSGETKNIPRHYGSYLRKHISTAKIHYYPNEFKTNQAISKFVNSKAKNNNYRRCDFQELFKDPQGQRICRDYFNGIFFIRDVTESKRLTHINSIMKYVKIFYRATYQPEILNNLTKD